MFFCPMPPSCIRHDTPQIGVSVRVSGFDQKSDTLSTIQSRNLRPHLTAYDLYGFEGLFAFVMLNGAEL